jgi:oxygen-independent coproporphyrinogen-3 oxidase
MSGIYIHIPYCRQACTYCNFHFSTNLSTKSELLRALHLEIDQRHTYLGSSIIQSVYFGGGTPSLLSASELQSILEHLKTYFRFDHGTEITLEANPDDLSPAYINELVKAGINRLSIGIQSFHAEDMKYMHRSHTPEQSFAAIQDAVDSGITNINIDLIYGAPTTGIDRWKKNLDIAFSLNIQHLSSYALTIEPKTVLAHNVARKIVAGPDDEDTILQLEYLMNVCIEHGFEQYEISNFARPGFRSRHNSSYWQGHHYLGLGPAAHSYDGLSRQWNVANNNQYILALRDDKPYYEVEVLTDTMKYNEYILTSIRTIEGIDMTRMHEPYSAHLKKQIHQWIEGGQLILERGHVLLTKEGKYIADKISADLFYE